MKEPKKSYKMTTPSSSGTSSSSSSDTDSSNNISRAIGGVFDGPDDRPYVGPVNMNFGRDITADDNLPPKNNSPQKLGPSSGEPRKYRYIPPSQRGLRRSRRDNDTWGDSNVSQQHFNEDWGKYSSQIGGNNSPEPQATAGRKSKENSPMLSKHAFSPADGTKPGEINPQQVNVPVPAGQASPAIIINVNHAPVLPAVVTPGVQAPPAPTIGSWDLPDEHKEKGSEKNSNESNDSSGSKNEGNRSSEHKKERSRAMEMPGAWGTSNVESQATSNGWNENENENTGDQANDNWGYSNNEEQENNNSWNGNEGDGERGSEGWGPTTAGAPENNTSWNNKNGNNENHDTAQGNNSWGHSNNNIDNNDGNIHGNSGWGNHGKGITQPNTGGTGAQQNSGWNCGNVSHQKDKAQSWGGAFEKKNGWDMPKKSSFESQGKDASDKFRVSPKYTMEFTQSPNNTNTASQENPAAPATGPGNENAAPDRAPIAGKLRTLTIRLFFDLSPDSTFQPKPYWANWNKLPEIPEEQSLPEPEPEPEPPAAANETLPGVPMEVAQRNNMSHQVQTDKPAPYMHKTSSAHHMDSLDCPYAVFSFKYRSSGKCLL